jgi:hypothetical protein
MTCGGPTVLTMSAKSECRSSKSKTINQPINMIKGEVMKHRSFAGTPFKFILVPALLLFRFAIPGALFAQEKSATETNMQILEEKIRADKKVVVAGNMQLTDEEAKAFWPVYDDYQKELQGLNARIKKTVESYAAAYGANTLTDEGARKLVNEAMSIDESEIQARKALATKLDKVLPGKKAARYLQIESKIRAIVRYELASEIPLAK